MKKNIALVTGGYSGEAVISYKSAAAISANIDIDKWNIYLIDIHPSGWFHPTASGEKIIVDKNDFSITVAQEKINFDAVLISLHGTPGEDGKLQGYFDCLHIPYTTCDAATSALTFNKRYTVAVAAFAGLHVAKSMHLFKYDGTTAAQICNQLKLPVFVKPNNGGSSIGMSKVTDAADVEEEIAEKVRLAARKAYAVFNCKGIVRIDFIYEEEIGYAYMLEINTVPGQSAASLVPQQVVAMGWTLKEFYSALIEESL
jgi:D-alanine-D-alanine ligase